MALSVTARPLSLVIHDVSRMSPELEVIPLEDPQDIRALCAGGNPIKPRVWVGRWEGEVPDNLVNSPFSQGYLSVVSTSSWRGTYEWVEYYDPKPEPGALNQEIGKVDDRPITLKEYLFREDGYEYFWERFKNHPIRREAEVTILMLLRKSQGPFSESDLKSRYELNPPRYIEALRYNIGTPKGTELLIKIGDNEVYPLVIDIKGPCLFTSALQRHPHFISYLALLQNRILQGGINPRIMTILFHQWLVMVGLGNRPSYEQQVQLQELLTL